MNIEIRKLTPNLAEDYARFFDVTPHDVRTDKDKAELPCYCVTWRSDDSYAGNGDHWYPSREERRERAIQFVRDGSLQGYLAYRGDEIVGWCNASGDCRGCVDYIRSSHPVEQYNPNVAVKSIFCFVIAPEAQGMGLATKLVERVCRDAAADGFDFVEAYPTLEFVPFHCRGPYRMYEKCGFRISNERDGKAVVRKALKE